MRARHFSFIATGIGIAVIGRSSVEAGAWPAREQLAAKAWTIEFSSADRAVAEGLMAQLGAFEQRTLALSGQPQELGFAEIEKRGGELARRVSEICVLPGHAGEFRREFARAAAELERFVKSLNTAFLLRKIELWRASEVSARLSAGEKIPGFIWNEKANRPEVRFNFSWQMAKDRHATTTVETPPAIMLRIEQDSSVDVALAAATKSFGEWIDVMGQSYLAILPMTTRVSLTAAMRTVLAAECASDLDSHWVSEGLTLWAWRELVFQSISPKAAPQYAPRVVALEVPRSGGKRVDLAAWPDKEDGEYGLYAAQLFNNVAERDGVEELSALLKQFWQLPRDQRTSASLRRLYFERTKQPLELRAPWRSLGAPVLATNDPAIAR